MRDFVKLFLFLKVISLLFLGSARASAPAYQAVQGTLDLTSWNPGQQKSLPLDGEWGFRWMELEDQAELASRRTFLEPAERSIQTGKSWKDVLGEDSSGLGYATQILKIKGLRAQANELALNFSQFISCYRMYLYDSLSQELVLFAESGRVGKTIPEQIYQYKRVLKPLPAIQGQDIYLIMQVSSLQVEGGFSLAPEIGLYEDFQKRSEHTAWESFYILGMFSFLVISNLFLFLLRREDKPSLVMALFALLMGIRYVSTEGIIARFFPEPIAWNFYISFYIIGLALQIGFTLYMQFFAYTFPKVLPRYVLPVAWGTCIVQALWTQVSRYVPGWPSLYLQFLLVVFAMGTVMLAKLVLLAWRRERGAALSLLGISFIVLAMANDVFVWMKLYDFIYIGHYGMLAFIFCQSLVVASNFAHAFRTAERLSQDLQVEVDRQTRDVKTILANIHQGILTVRPGLTVGDDYSQYLCEILQDKNIENRNVLDLLFHSSQLNQEQKDMVRTILEGSIGEAVLNFEMNEDNLVRDTVLKDGQGRQKNVLIDWDPVVNEKTEEVEKILVTLRDVTELRAMEAKTRQQQRDMELIAEIIEVAADRFQNFLASSRRFLEENGRLLQAAAEPSGEVLKIIFINLHTMKGAARTYRFTSMTAIIHDAEHFIASVQKQQMPWDAEHAWQDHERVLGIFQEYERVNRDRLKRVDAKDTVRLDLDTVRENIRALEAIGEIRLDDRLTPFVDQVRKTFFQLYYQDVDHLFAELVKILPQLGRDLQKPDPEVILRSVPAGLTKEAADVLHDIFIHIFRNIMDHGIESPDERQKKGKTAQGRINIDLSVNRQGDLQISIEDDGQGIRLDRVKEIAAQRQLLDPNRNYSFSEIAELIFLPGFSTAKGVTEVSGRGVGMSAVMEYIRNLGGRVELKLTEELSQLGPCPFRLELVLPHACFTLYQAARRVA